jgi:uncharacterized protein (UPF0548 family)
MVNLRVGLIDEEVHTKPPSHTDDGAVEPKLTVALPRRCWSWREDTVESYWRWRCQGDAGYGVISLSSHAGDDVVEATLAMVRCRCRVMLATVLPRHLGLGVM